MLVQVDAAPTALDCVCCAMEVVVVVVVFGRFGHGGYLVGCWWVEIEGCGGGGCVRSAVVGF